jgi:hypothetical protein
VSLWTAGHQTDPTGLDNLAQGTISAAGFARSVCASAVEPASFETPLIKPLGWTGVSQSRPERLNDALAQAIAAGAAADPAQLLDAGASEEGAYAGLRDFARAFAEPRGLRIEDGAAFDRAFPHLPFTGWTQVAFSGRLTDGRALRLAVSAQRPYVADPRVASGAVLGVSPAAPGTAEQGLAHDPSLGAFTAVSGGLRCIWRPHDGMSADHDSLTAVAAKIIAAA